jgi:hypothetical protein
VVVGISVVVVGGSVVVVGISVVVVGGSVVVVGGSVVVVGISVVVGFVVSEVPLQLASNEKVTIIKSFLNNPEILMCKPFGKWTSKHGGFFEKNAVSLNGKATPKSGCFPD